MQVNLKSLATDASGQCAPSFNHLASKPKVRRQNHSCDQCRKSKRACNAEAGPYRRNSEASHSGGDQRFYARNSFPPCSYCIKTKKRCTMDWAKSQIHHSKPPKVGLRRSTTSEHTDSSKSPPMIHDAVSPWEPIDLVHQYTAPGFEMFPDDTQLVGGWDPPVPNLGLAEPVLGGFDALPLGAATDQDEIPQEGMIGDTFDILTGSTLFSSDQCQPFLASSGSPGQKGKGLGDDTSRSPWQALQSRSATSHPPHSSTNPFLFNQDIWAPRQRRPSLSCYDGPESSLSPFSIDQTMMNKTNNHMTSANLLHIYHDVLEHHLSCWLTEVTCPYRTVPSYDGNAAPVSSEWGPSWSNRIYQRTVKLDCNAQTTRLLNLSRSEDQAASRALHLAIMAFATQWAQGSHRHRERYPSTGSPDFSHVDIADSVAQEFDRNLQQHFWSQAHRALQDVADVECFRVACAEVIFALTQKPWISENDFVEGDVTQHQHEDMEESVLPQVRAIIRKEGPPVFMERAARKMHALKFQADCVERSFIKPVNGDAVRDHDNAIEALSTEDQSTIGLLYWLAIMFDTVSSSMNERPVVVLDEDCQHDKTRKGSEPATDSQGEPLPRGRWDMAIFIPKGSHKTSESVHWPCSYDLAAETVTKSAPIKVLLFRHVSYLQNSIRRGANQRQIEHVINSTTSLYRYWNKTHGNFFRELIQDYDCVPQRIQGWFVCISAHWHLAALMLSELIEFVDNSQLGTTDAADARATSRMVTRIRRDSANELSDLARVATPSVDENLSAPQMTNFHQAVNEGTILGEPWTMILIRAFTKASLVFFIEADDFLRHGRETLGQSDDGFKRNLERAEDCIKALWLLGKKSDMARKIAITLSLALSKLHNK